MPVLPVGSMTKYGVDVPIVKSPAKVVVPMPSLPSEKSENMMGLEENIPEETVKSPAKVELALTIMPTVEVGRMAAAPMNCQFDGVIQEVSFHSEFPKESVAVSK